MLMSPMAPPPMMATPSPYHMTPAPQGTVPTPLQVVRVPQVASSWWMLVDERSRLIRGLFFPPPSFYWLKYKKMFRTWENLKLLTGLPAEKN